MAQLLTKTKEQVEADLEFRSASITNRLDAIESNLPVPPKQIRNLLTRKTLIRSGVVVAVGMIAGIVFLRRQKDPVKGFREELGLVSGAIGKEIRKNLSRGLSTDDAVSKALDKRPPVVNMGADGGSVLSNVLSTLSRHIASAIGPVIADKIADRLRGEPDEK